MSAPYVPEDTRRPPVNYYAGGDISALDNDTYADASPLPTAERSRIVDSSGNAVSESQEVGKNAQGRTILAALDFSREEHVANVTKETLSIAKSGDTVILFNVLSPTMDGSSVVDKLRLRSDEQVKTMSKISKQFGSGITTFVHVVHGKPENQLLKVAAQHHVDLVILGRRKLSGIKKIATTSVSASIIDKVNASVLIARGTSK